MANEVRVQAMEKFWEQLWEERSRKLKVEHAMMLAYKRQAAEEKRRREKYQNILLGIGALCICAVCTMGWIALLGG